MAEYSPNNHKLLYSQYNSNEEDDMDDGLVMSDAVSPNNRPLRQLSYQERQQQQNLLSRKQLLPKVATNHSVFTFKFDDKSQNKSAMVVNRVVGGGGPTRRFL